MAADERLRSAGGAGLAVRGASGIVRRMLEIMRVTSLLDARGPDAGEPTVASVRPRKPRQAGRLDLARHLYDAENLDDVLTRIATVSVSAVPGCEMASITVREDGTFRTVVSTHEAATAADSAQYEASEGPCLSAVEEAVIHTPAFPDPRWPTLGARPADLGVHAAVSYSLTPSGPVTDAPLAGSLNAYAGVAGAFDDQAREIGLVLAAHASIAVCAVGDRGALEQLGRQLHAALASRDVIGQAKGILMERLRITPEDAFDTLRRSSQRLNAKLREIAQKLAETGEFDDPDGP